MHATKARKIARWCGAIIPNYATAADLRDLAALGANHVRWQLTRDGFPSYRASNEPLAAYADWLEGALRHVDTMLPHCRALGLQIVFDLHTPRGNHGPHGHWRLFLHRAHPTILRGMIAPHCRALPWRHYGFGVRLDE